MSDIDPNEKKVVSDSNGESNWWQRVKDNCKIQ